MRAARIPILFLLLGGLGGCCSPKTRTEPKPPESVAGWKDYYDTKANVHKLGEFLLRKGESTANGEIQVKLVDIIPPDPCATDAGMNAYYPKAILQFIRVSDAKVLVEDRYREGASSNAHCNCAIATVWMHDINVKESWASFQLIGLYDK
jgi:hypothetical protein